MKPIEDMNLGEIASFLETGEPSAYSLEQRLRELREEHEALKEQTRWIPVSERLPTEADADQYGYVLWWSEDEVALPVAHYWDFTGVPKYHFTHWQRITPPEGP